MLTSVGGVNEDQLNENRPSLLTQSLIQQRGQPLSLLFGRDSKVVKGVSKLFNRKKGRV